MCHLFVCGQLNPELSYDTIKRLLVKTNILGITTKLISNFVLIVSSTSVGHQKFIAYVAKKLVSWISDRGRLYKTTLCSFTS